MNKPIRVGIFGVGFRGNDTGRGGSLIGCFIASGAEVVALCDTNPDALNYIREHCGAVKDAAIYESFDEFIKHDMDAVLLSNYFTEHAPYAIRAMKAGKHVLSETTSSITMAQSVALCRAAEETGMTYALLENYPFFKSNQEIERLYRGGTLGRLSYAEGEYVHPVDSQSKNNLAPGEYHWRNWLPRSYYITHSLAPLMQLTDCRPTRVTAMASFQPEIASGTASHVGDSAAVVLCQTDTDAILRVTGCAGFAPHGNYYRLCCTKGGIDTNRSNGHVRLSYNPWATPEGCESFREYDPEWPDADLAALADQSGHGGGDFYAIYKFIKALENGTEPYWNVYRATTLASVAILSWRSILNGNIPFDIPDFRKEEDRLKFEYDDASPFPDENGHVNFACCSKPYAPTPEDMANAQADWIKTGVLK